MVLMNNLQYKKKKKKKKKEEDITRNGIPKQTNTKLVSKYCLN